MSAKDEGTEDTRTVRYPQDGRSSWTYGSCTDRESRVVGVYKRRCLVLFSSYVVIGNYIVTTPRIS